MPLFKLGAKTPQVGDNAWVAPNATVIGDVRLGRNASIWWNATLRGDNDPIHIGDNTNIRTVRCCTPTKACRCTSATMSRSAIWSCCTAAPWATAA